MKFCFNVAGQLRKLRTRSDNLTGIKKEQLNQSEVMDISSEEVIMIQKYNPIFSPEIRASPPQNRKTTCTHIGVRVAASRVTLANSG